MWINWIQHVGNSYIAVPRSPNVPLRVFWEGIVFVCLIFFRATQFRGSAGGDDLLTAALLWNHIMSSITCRSCQGCCHSCLQMESTDADNVHSVHYSAVYLYFQPHFGAVDWQGGSKTIKPATDWISSASGYKIQENAESDYVAYNAMAVYVDIIRALRLCCIMQSYP